MKMKLMPKIQKISNSSIRCMRLYKFNCFFFLFFSPFFNRNSNCKTNKQDLAKNGIPLTTCINARHSENDCARHRRLPCLPCNRFFSKKISTFLIQFTKVLTRFPDILIELSCTQLCQANEQWNATLSSNQRRNQRRTLELRKKKNLFLSFVARVHTK